MAITETLLQTALNQPTQTLFTGLALSALIIIFDAEDTVSFKLPGRRRIGLALIVAAGSSALFFYAQGGLTAFAGEIAAGIFGAVVTGTVIAWYMKNG